MYLADAGIGWEWTASILVAHVWFDRDAPARSAERAAEVTPGVECVSFRRARREPYPTGH
jgi:hypothetical protein